VLSNLLVLELASVLAGPSVGQFFAELGATVVKVENPRTGGDVTRRWNAPNGEAAGNASQDDRSAYFCCCNAGKKSVALDLSTRGGQKVLHALVPRADIVLTNFRPGTAERLGADAPTLRGLNERLIVGTITGYGEDDDRAGFDAVIQAESGFTYINGEPGGPPVKLPVALMDVLAAHQLKEGLLVKLIERMQTGNGGVVSVSLLQSAVSGLVNQATNYLVAGHVPERMGSAHPNIAPYGTLYPTADGHSIVLAVGTDRQFRALCHVFGRDDLADDPNFSTNAGRVANRDMLDRILRSCTEQIHTEVLLTALDEANVPAGRVRAMPQVFEQASARAMTLQPDTSTDEFGSGAPIGLRQVAFPRPDDAETLAPPPRYGEHTASVLRDHLNLSQDDINLLEDDGAISLPASSNA
jgi:crotonobetainyl-CoA:carnitine CoA-transferase CaiB-like acyl-CoA transferase